MTKRWCPTHLSPLVIRQNALTTECLTHAPMLTHALAHALSRNSANYTINYRAPSVSDTHMSVVARDGESVFLILPNG